MGIKQTLGGRNASMSQSHRKTLMWTKCTLRKKQTREELITHWRAGWDTKSLTTASWHKTASALLMFSFRNVFIVLKLLSVISVMGPISRTSPALQPWCSALFLSPTWQLWAHVDRYMVFLESWAALGRLATRSFSQLVSGSAQNIWQTIPTPAALQQAFAQHW